VHKKIAQVRYAKDSILVVFKAHEYDIFDTAQLRALEKEMRKANVESLDGPDRTGPVILALNRAALKRAFAGYRR
jgi:hypothetical protein